jgi:CheY-like chemotaxis protein
MPNLLLVDDDDFVRSALSRVLNRTGGFAVIPAEHGRRALEVLATEHVDAILTDLQMPVMDGLTLLAELFEKGIRLPVAVMTGQQIHADLRHRLQTYGIAAVFSKPVDVVLLADELQRVLDPQAVGRISGITLFGLLQLLEVERKSGLVLVKASQREGRLYFDEGALVHAHTRVLDGLEAAYEILGWPDPAVEIFYKRRARQRTVREPLQHVLMEAARLLDESARPGVEEGRAVQTAPQADVDADTLLAEVVKIDGAIGAALVQATNGAVLGQVTVGRGLDMTRAGKIAQDLVQAALRLRDGIEDIMITVDTQYHLMRLLGSGEDVFVHLVLDRERASLGMARQQLAKLARTASSESKN